MIPQFPKFKKLEFNDKDEVESVTNAFPPYSDYNFVSLWSYNTEDSILLSLLNNNLVIRFQDYITNEPFYSFIGDNKVYETIEVLLSHAEKEHLSPELKLIPEITLKDRSHLEKDFQILKDDSNHDYILSVAELTTLAGNKYGSKRNFVNRFKRMYPHCAVKEIDLTNDIIKTQIIQVFNAWEKRKGAERKDTTTELTAIERLLRMAQNLKLFTLGIYDVDTMIGFSIQEVSHDHFGIIHFEKADIQYVGIFQFLKQQTAEYLGKMGIKHINYEQDLGIEGLRKAKRSYHPTHYLNKYTITKK